MVSDPSRDLYALFYAAAKLGVWLAVFAAIFVPIERIFALHSQKIFRKEVASTLATTSSPDFCLASFSPRRFRWRCS